jgi:Fe-S cluster assembly ATP-binding protein
MSDALLVIENLKVTVEGKEILKGINLHINQGEVHAIMGPNGSGKSTLSNTLMGHPKYKVTSGRIIYKGQELDGSGADARARQGIFLAFQYPIAIPGVTVMNFVRQSLKAVRGSEIPVAEFRKLIKEKMQLLEVSDAFVNGRYVNDGFSGGEKKRLEILQMAILEPRLAILDETDSGLDIDALKIVAQGIEKLRAAERSMLLITHYQRILNYVQPDVVHVLAGGQIVKTGSQELSKELEAKGYDWVLKEFAGKN